MPGTDLTPSAASGLARRPEKPPATIAEHLTRNFYDWEKRGRGWRVYCYPVELEPAFKIFFHELPQHAQDDGKVPGIWDALSSAFQSPSPPAEAPVPELLQEMEPQPLEAWDPVELQITLPSAFKVQPEMAENFLLQLSYAGYPVSFELIGLPGQILMQMSCHEDDLGSLRQSFRAFYRDATIRETREGFLSKRWNPSAESLAADFGLSQEFMLPIRTNRDLEVDSLTGIVSALEDIREGELGVFQVLFQKTVYAWTRNTIRAVLDFEGQPFFSDAPNFMPLAKEKIGKPFFAAVVRAAGQSLDRDRPLEIVKNMASAMKLLSRPGSNEFFPLSNDDYPDSAHEEDVVSRLTRRSGMLLSCEELATLVHLPSASIRSEKLRQKVRKTKLAPEAAKGHETVLGQNEHNGQAVSVSLSPEQRVKHTYVIGASGTGKSTLLLNLILQDIEQGKGLGVLDPHGDLIDQILGAIPEKRHRDVVLFDPSDSEYPIGFNILSAHSEVEKNLLSSDLVAVFRRLSTTWGDQMNSVLGNAILAFLESEQGGTLSDLRRFLVEKTFRNSFLETVKDREIVYYWQKEFPLLQGRPQAPILTRLDAFLRPKLIRNMVCQKESKLNISAVMNEGNIFLGKLAQGAIGEENAFLLGSFLVSKFHQGALARQEIPEDKRRDFYLYIDEFHNFITPSMASILQGGRKFRLGLTLAHQELRQLSRSDGELSSAVLANPYTRISFRVGEDDAKKLSEGFSSFEAKDLQNLGTGEAVCRVEKAEQDFNLATLPIEKKAEESSSEMVRTLSRERCATHRTKVEEDLGQRYAAVEFEEKPEPEKEEPAQSQPEVRTRPMPETPLPKALAVSPAKNLPVPGRGGQQHKYLQHLIKKYAEDKDYRAEIEKSVLDGSGRVDVALERNGRSIACEVSVTTGAEQELGNLKKCLAAGFEKAILVSAHRRTLNEVKALAEGSLDKGQVDHLYFFSPEEFFSFLEAEEAEAAGKETIVKGYRVKTTFKAVSDDEKELKKQTIAQTILKALKRLKGS